MKKLSLFIIASLINMIVHQLFAVPAVPWPVEKVQPDGTKISVYLKGDERVNWMECLEGYTLMYDSQKNIVFAEQNSAGDLVPSKIKYSQSTLRSAEVKNLEKGLHYSTAQVNTLNQIWEIGNNARAPQKAAPATGNRKALCVLMDFPDKPMVKTVEEFEALMNQVGYSVGSAKGSVKDFYLENSYGKLDLTVTVVGPYTTANNLSYYTTNNGYQALAREAATAAAADVDLTEFAENGSLETFHIIFAGYGDEAIGNGRQIWSHKWSLHPTLMLDEVEVSVYSCSPELRHNSGSTLTAIGVVCHELSHVFGAPDYYDANDANGGQFEGTGNWDLMAIGSWNDNGDTPAHINMFQKILYEWVDPIELATEQEIVDMPNSAENPVAYTIKANNNGEMYVLENRQKVGFDAAIPGHGLLIYHIHQNALSGNGNNNSHPQQVYPVSAAATTAIPNHSPSSYGPISEDSTPFPGTSGQTEFTDYTTPQAFSWATMLGIEKPITNITEIEEKISFSFMGGETTAKPNAAENLSATVSGITVTLTWTAPSNEQEDGYDGEVSQYLVLRNGSLIETTENLTFSDQLYTTDEYCYTVVVRYSDNQRSAPTSAACIQLESIPNLEPVTNFKATATPDTDDIVLTWNASASAEFMPVTYKIYRKARQELIFTLLAEGLTEPTYTDVVSYYTRYCYYVKTVNAINAESGASSQICADVIAPATITTQPVGGSICEDSGYTFSVEATGKDLTYQWYHNNEVIAEATANELTLQGVKAVDAGNYKVEVTCAERSFSIESSVVKLTVLNKPSSDIVFVSIPEALVSGTTYSISIISESGEIEATDIRWSFSGTDVTIEPANESNCINLIVGEDATDGLLKVTLTNGCGTYSIEQSLETTTVGISNLSVGRINVGPNPIKDVLNITSDTNIKSITITNVNGSTIYTNSDETTLSNNINIYTSSWASGLYIVRITTAEKEVIQKIIKE